MAGHSAGRPLRKTHATDIDYAAMATGKVSPKQPVEASNSKHRRKASTPKKLSKVKIIGEVTGAGDSAFLKATNGKWSVTPVTREKSNKREYTRKHVGQDVMHDSLDNLSAVVSEEGEVTDVEVHAADDNEFTEEVQNKEEVTLHAEIAEMRKRLENKKLKVLKRQKEKLRRALAEDLDESDREEVQRLEVVKSKKRKSNDKGNDKQDFDKNNEWECLISASKLSLERESRQGSINRGTMPSFDQIKAMFADEPTTKRKKTQLCEVRPQGSDEEEVEDSGNEDRGHNSPTSTARGKVNPTSGFFAKASDTKIVKQVVHAHAMLDSEETNGQDLALNELPFHLLVSGEMEIVLGACTPEEKWTRLNLLRQLSYKAQYLSQSTVVERYAGFLRKVEKGKFGWGSETAIRELEENLRFRVFTSNAKVVGGSKVGDNGKRMGGNGKSGGIGNSIVQITIEVIVLLRTHMKDASIEW